MSSHISPPSALLLLPPPPSFSIGGVKIFEPSLSDVLVKLSDSVKESKHIATIDIALAIPGLHSPSGRPHAKIFAQLQHYLTSIYTLIGAVAAARDIELDSPGGINARVIFVDHNSSDRAVSPASASPRIGPILDLHSLATSGRQWNHVFHLSNHAGQKLADSFHDKTAGSSKDHMASIMQSTIISGDWSVPESLLVPEDLPSAVPHYSVAVGGTFDHLHVGHKLLLTATALAMEPLDQADEASERLLTVGVTGDALLVNKKYAECLESWEERFQATASFLGAIMDFSGNLAPQIERIATPAGKGKEVVVRILPNLAYKFVEIFDVCGPTITDENISALVLSKETQAGGAIVNEERVKKGWPKLAIFEVDVLQSEEATGANGFESKISSTDIRRRRMNRAKV